MQPGERVGTVRWTRGQALRAVVVGGAAVGGGALLGRGLDAGASAQAPSAARDAEILGFLLQLEQVQEGLYRAAAAAGRLDGPLREYVRAVAPQEKEHVAFLAQRAGSSAGKPPRSDFSDVVRTPESFRSAAIDLEELTLAAYIGQGANLTRRAVADVARLVSVEARQVAWLRDISGKMPAPAVADPARTPDEVLDALRERSYIL
jgi:Ferritin-like domain